MSTRKQNTDMTIRKEGIGKCITDLRKIWC